MDYNLLQLLQSRGLKKKARTQTRTHDRHTNEILEHHKELKNGTDDEVINCLLFMNNFYIILVKMH